MARLKRNRLDVQGFLSITNPRMPRYQWRSLQTLFTYKWLRVKKCVCPLLLPGQFFLPLWATRPCNLSHVCKVDGTGGRDLSPICSLQRYFKIGAATFFSIFFILIASLNKTSRNVGGCKIQTAKEGRDKKL